MIRECVAALLVTWLVGCGAPAPPPSADASPGAVTVRSDLPLQQVRVHDADGVQVARRDLGPEVFEARLAVEAAPGTRLSLDVLRGDGMHRLTVAASAAHGPLTLRLDAPVGQGAVPVLHGAELPVNAIGGGGTAAWTIRAAAAGAATLEVCGSLRRIALRGGGEGEVVITPIPGPGRCPVVLEQGAERIAAELEVVHTDPAAAARDLEIVDVALPTDARGRPEPARAPGRITLPASWWRSLLTGAGLGYRPRDGYRPWASTTVALANRGDAPLNVVVQLRVLETGGAPAPAFRPRMRDTTGDTGVVTGLVRVPAGDVAQAVLPLFVDDERLPEGSSEYVRELVITPLGGSVPLHVDRAPLRVQRGRAWVSGLFAIHLLAALLGWLALARGLPGWVRRASTADLTTIAVFSTLVFVTGAAAAVLGSAVGAVLGPFQGFVTGFLDDALRYTLLATLVVLLPRPGVLATAEIVSFLLRGIAMGGFDPASALFLPARILWMEALLFAVGATRGSAWLTDARWKRWLRLGVGFATASALTGAGALVTQMVLYRLHYAGWYLLALIVGPGFLYVWVACGLATGFSESLREVEP